LIIFTFKKDVTIPSTNVKLTIQSSTKCGGTLINRNTILSAAHCIPSTVSFSYNGQTYQTQVQVSSYHPTIQSMFKIYLGVYNSSALNQTPTQAYDVAQLITVIFIINYN
jgi:V8-like Glu-specific endopeptidase